MPGDLAMGKSLAKNPSFERLSIIPKDVPLAEAIKSPRKTHSSRFHVTERRELEKLPSLHGIFQQVADADVPTNNRPELFIQKLEQCNVIFDFRDPSMDIRSKEIKRSTLQELLEYISNNRNVIQPSMYGKIVNMVCHIILLI
jgi:serine/threonine-protein phosphatase 2A regulatory subunit B'